MDETAELIAEFIAAHHWRAATRAAYRRYAARLLSDLPVGPGQPSPTGLVGWLDNPAWVDSTRRLALAAARAYLRWRYGARHPALRLDVWPRNASRAPKTPRTLSGGQIDALLRSFNTRTPVGARDLALCALMLDTGLRASEVCSLRLSDLDTAGAIWHGQVLVKGGRWERFPVPPYTASLIAAWLGHRQIAARPRCAALFVSLGGRTRGRALTRRGLAAICNRWAADAGIPALSPHDLRRTFATQMLRNGAPTRVVQVAGRWRSAAMVERYSAALAADDALPYSPVERLLAA